MNKKGFLLGEETLKIVIAVICIAFLIYLLVAVYFSMTGEENKRLSEAVLTDKIIPEINRIDGGGEYSVTGVHVPNPSDWTIFSFVGEDKKPNSCVEKDCICICENAFPDWFDWQIKRCDDKGVCKIISNLAKFEKIKIEKSGVQISIQKVNDEIQIGKI
jgi:hypothetical protein